MTQVGVKSIVLPAAKETIDTWVHGFGFSFMDFDHEASTRRELRVLVFPGTRLLARNTAAVCLHLLSLPKVHLQSKQVEMEAIKMVK